MCALLLVVPFSIHVFADADGEEYSIPYTQINIYKYFQNTGFTLDQITTIVDSNTSQDKYECGNTTNTNYCLAYYKDRSTTDIHYIFNFGQIRATYNMPTAYNASNNFTFEDGKKYLFAFITDKSTVSNASAIETRYYYSGSSYYTATDYHRYLSNYTLYYSEYTYSGSNRPVTAALYNMAGKTFNVIPLYYGDVDNCPSDVYKLIYGSDPEIDKLLNAINDVNTILNTINTNVIGVKNAVNNVYSRLATTNNYLDLIYDVSTQTANNTYAIHQYLLGDHTTESSSYNLSQKSDDLSSVTSDLNTFETNLASDLTTQMNAIDLNTSGSIITNNNFLRSSNWVRTQYNRMITNNPFGSMISFSLVIGLSLLIIGKLRK